MDYVLLIISGVIVGLIAAVPVGPVNLICIRRTFAFGPLNGFVSGLGAALGDGVFAIVVGFGLTAVRQLIEGYAPIIQLIGGAMMIFFGVKTYVAPPDIHLEDGVRVKNRDKGASSLARAIISTFALTVTNPATLIFFATMFAGVGGLAGASFVNAAFIVGGVVGGSAGWWLVLTTVIGLFHAKITDRGMRVVNKISGLTVAIFGVAVLTHLAIRTL
jgi:threonine/homoserine/homoserine lactone efflux protein